MSLHPELPEESPEVVHTPEPWHIGGWSIFNSDDEKIGEMCGELTDFGDDYKNAKRAVLSVNATAGISNEALEAGELQNLIKAAATVVSMFNDVFMDVEAAKAQFDIMEIALQLLGGDLP